MTAIPIDGRLLHPGLATGPVLVLDEPLSMWGGLDPTTGRILDQQHRQAGVIIAGKIVAMPGSRGSSGTPGVLGEALRNGVGPLGLILTKPDVNLIAGALVAEALYGRTCPITLVTSDVLGGLYTGAIVRVGDYDGMGREQ